MTLRHTRPQPKLFDPITTGDVQGTETYVTAFAAHYSAFVAGGVDGLRGKGVGGHLMCFQECGVGRSRFCLRYRDRY